MTDASHMLSLKGPLAVNKCLLWDGDGGLLTANVLNSNVLTIACRKRVTKKYMGGIFNNFLQKEPIVRWH